MHIVQVFEQAFIAHGYEEAPAIPVFPCPDQTTLFTCATISAFKPHLRDGSLKKAYVLQPCLRVQNLKRVLEEEFNPTYLSSFQMLGMIAPYEQFDAACIVDFFGLLPHLADRLLIRSSRAITHPGFALPEAAFKTEYDTRHTSYYHWQYGEQSLWGKGITFALRQLDGTYADIGNLVLVYQRDTCIAVEFGFGIETYTACEAGLTSPYAASSEFQRLELGLSAIEKRLGDALIISEKLYAAGVRPGSGRAASVLRKALRSACFLALRAYGPRVEERLLDLSRSLGSTSGFHLSVDLETAIASVKESLAAFEGASAHIRKHASDSAYAEVKIEQYRQRYGVPKEYT